MDYAKFEGIIPRGEYGGGTVMVWDIGISELIERQYWQKAAHISREKNSTGNGCLLKTPVEWRRSNVWYCIKAGASVAPPSVKEEDSSAFSRRSMDEIAGAPDAVWHSNRNGSGEMVPSDSASEKLWIRSPRRK